MDAAKDFSRMYEIAAAYATGGSLPDSEYLALFPHLTGYPFFLSLFFRVFGVSVAAAQVFNLLCSLGIAALLFSIGKKLMGVTGGLAAGLLWALLPPHFMLLSLTAGEPLHIMLTLLAVRVYLWAADSLSLDWKKSSTAWLLLGIVTGISSLVRPVGPVYLLAFTICFAVFVKTDWKQFARAVPVMLAGYFAVTLLLLSGGFGWNLYIGMNRDSGGSWNAADYAVLEARMEEGLSPGEIQSLFRDEGFRRLGERFGEGFGFFSFMAKKFAKLWSQDSFIVYWLEQGAREDSPLDIKTHAGTLALLCNLGYGFLLGCCAVSLVRQFRRRDEAFVLPVIILIGVTLLFLLLEANPRYHYAGSAVLCLLGAGCVKPADS
jgi:4-amino-4-deoxy-L-arabinose transferase-like glycosyltransferase